MWEYKTIIKTANSLSVDKFDKYLNEKGKDGWELIHLTISYMINNPREHSCYLFIFKKLIKQS